MPCQVSQPFGDMPVPEAWRNPLTDTAGDTSGSVAVATESLEQPRAIRRPATRWSVLGRLALGAAFAASAYITYQRGGTTANVEDITHFEAYGDRCAAVGMTHDQPGFVLIAAMPREDFRLWADLRENAAAGAWTVLQIGTARQQWNKRLRGPLAITIDEHGTVRSEPLDWSLAQLQQAADAMDCNKHLKTCGVPTEDLSGFLATSKTHRTPKIFKDFFAAYARGEHERNN